MKAAKSTYITFTRRPWLAVAGFLAVAFLLVSCGGSAPGATSDSIDREQATPTPALERPTQIRPTQIRPTQIRPTEEGATGTGGVTPIVVPTPDQGGPSREALVALLASPTPEAQVPSPSATPEAQVPSPSATPEQEAEAPGQQATLTPNTGSISPLETATPPPAPTPTPSPSRQVGGKVGDQAAEVEGIWAWINSEPLTIQELRGKVVLVDFWTYTCINCIRTFPFLKLWQARYADAGLVILGVHTPEFDFEKELDNVVTATRDNGIVWPVALDNDYVTWRNYSNRFWPAKYLIDRDGVVRYTHFGEGAYAVTEQKIRELLEESGADLRDDDFPPLSDQQLDPAYRESRNAEITRELYAGYERGFNDALYGQGGYVRQEEYYLDRDVNVIFDSPEELLPHLIYFNGLWRIGPESASHGRNSEGHEDYLTIVYSARSVNAVLTSDSGEDYRVRITMNGENLTDDNKGADVTIGPGGESYVLVTEPRMYNIVENPIYLRRRTLRMSSDSADFGLFAFTFGVYQKAG